MRKTWKKVIALSLVAAMAVSAGRLFQVRTDFHGTGGSAQDERRIQGSRGRRKRRRFRGVQGYAGMGAGSGCYILRPPSGKETPAVEVTDQIFDTLTVVDAATGELQPQIARELGSEFRRHPTHSTSARA